VPPPPHERRIEPWSPKVVSIERPHQDDFVSRNYSFTDRNFGLALREAAEKHKPIMLVVGGANRLGSQELAADVHRQLNNTCYVDGTVNQGSDKVANHAVVVYVDAERVSKEQSGGTLEKLLQQRGLLDSRKESSDVMMFGAHSGRDGAIGLEPVRYEYGPGLHEHYAGHILTIENIKCEPVEWCKESAQAPEPKTVVPLAPEKLPVEVVPPQGSTANDIKAPHGQSTAGHSHSFLGQPSQESRAPEVDKARPTASPTSSDDLLPPLDSRKRSLTTVEGQRIPEEPDSNPRAPKLLPQLEKQPSPSKSVESSEDYNTRIANEKISRFQEFVVENRVKIISAAQAKGVELDHPDVLNRSGLLVSGNRYDLLPAKKMDEATKAIGSCSTDAGLYAVENDINKKRTDQFSDLVGKVRNVSSADSENYLAYELLTGKYVDRETRFGRRGEYRYGEPLVTNQVAWQQRLAEALGERLRNNTLDNSLAARIAFEGVGRAEVTPGARKHLAEAVSTIADKESSKGDSQDPIERNPKLSALIALTNALRTSVQAENDRTEAIQKAQTTSDQAQETFQSAKQTSWCTPIREENNARWTRRKLQELKDEQLEEQKVQEIILEKFEKWQAIEAVPDLDAFMKNQDTSSQLSSRLRNSIRETRNSIVRFNFPKPIRVN
jgi:hypothetical protein